jgi:hypothetical protein
MSRRPVEAHLPTPAPLWIARVAGSQEEMGRQHGALLAAAGGADRTIRYYRDLPVRALVGGVPPAVRGLAAAGLRGVGRRLLRRLDAHRPPALAARSRAFMAALGRPAIDAHYLGVMDLLQNLVGLAARKRLGPFGAPLASALTAAAQPACSTAVVWGAASRAGVLRHARNFDFPGIGVWDAGPSLVLCAPTDGHRYGFIATRGADVPAVTVFNEAGLVITTHTRFHHAVRFDGATIVDVVHEIARRATTLAEAIAIAGRRPSASTWGVAVSSAREARAVVLELNGDRLAVVEPAAGDEQLVCCNRYRHPSMRDGEVAASPAWAAHTEAREASLRAGLAAARSAGGADVEALARMLVARVDPSDESGSVRLLGGVVGQAAQVQSVVIEPTTRTLWLGTGAAPVGEGRWLRVRWDWDGAPGAWQVDDAAPAGLGVTVDDAFALPRHPAADAVARAQIVEHEHHDPEATAAALAAAIELAPGDPSLRLAMTWVELRRRRWSAAREQAALGLARERLPYRRGQLLLWGARAALAAGDAAQAATWRSELANLAGKGVDALQAEALRDVARGPRAARRKPVVNLIMHDAT